MALLLCLLGLGAFAGFEAAGFGAADFAGAGCGSGSAGLATTTGAGGAGASSFFAAPGGVKDVAEGLKLKEAALALNLNPPEEAAGFGGSSALSSQLSLMLEPQTLHSCCGPLLC